MEKKTVKTPLRWLEVYDLYVKTMSDAAWERALAAQPHSSRICSKSLTTLRPKQRSSSSKTIHYCLRSDTLLIVHNRTCVFQRSVVLAEGDIQVTDYSQELSGFLRWTWKLAFKRTQQDTLDIISCRRMIEYRRGVFYVFVLINNRDAIF